MTLSRGFEMPLALAERVSDLYDEALKRYGDINGELLAARLIAERVGSRSRATPRTLNGLRR